MAKIKEDYVSPETAKLLKEKGFEGYSIITIYDENAASAYIKELQEKHLPYSSDDPKLKEFYYTQPTLQMAMKWLREKHNFHIWVEPNHDKEGLYNAHVKVGWWSNNWCGVGYNTYEKACEAAIKYCLKHLI